MFKSEYLSCISKDAFSCAVSLYFNVSQLISHLKWHLKWQFSAYIAYTRTFHVHVNHHVSMNLTVIPSFGYMITYVVKILYRIARDPRFKRLPCLHKGTYADDCIVQRITHVNTHTQSCHIRVFCFLSRNTLWINFEFFEYRYKLIWLYVCIFLF